MVLQEHDSTACPFKNISSLQTISYLIASVGHQRHMFAPLLYVRWGYCFVIYAVGLYEA